MNAESGDIISDGMGEVYISDLGRFNPFKKMKRARAKIRAKARARKLGRGRKAGRGRTGKVGKARERQRWVPVTAVSRFMSNGWIKTTRTKFKGRGRSRMRHFFMIKPRVRRPSGARRPVSRKTVRDIKKLKKRNKKLRILMNRRKILGKKAIRSSKQHFEKGVRLMRSKNPRKRARAKKYLRRSAAMRAIAARASRKQKRDRKKLSRGKGRRRQLMMKRRQLRAKRRARTKLARTRLSLKARRRIAARRRKARRYRPKKVRRARRRKPRRRAALRRVAFRRKAVKKRIAAIKRRALLMKKQRNRVLKKMRLRRRRRISKRYKMTKKKLASLVKRRKLSRVRAIALKRAAKRRAIRARMALPLVTKKMAIEKFRRITFGLINDAKIAWAEKLNRMLEKIQDSKDQSRKLQGSRNLSESAKRIMKADLESRTVSLIRKYNKMKRQKELDMIKIYAASGVISKKAAAAMIIEKHDEQRERAEMIHIGGKYDYRVIDQQGQPVQPVDLLQEIRMIRGHADGRTSKGRTQLRKLKAIHEMMLKSNKGAPLRVVSVYLNSKRENAKVTRERGRRGDYKVKPKYRKRDPTEPFKSSVTKIPLREKEESKISINRIKKRIRAWDEMLRRIGATRRPEIHIARGEFRDALVANNPEAIRVKASNFVKIARRLISQVQANKSTTISFGRRGRRRRRRGRRYGRSGSRSSAPDVVAPKVVPKPVEPESLAKRFLSFKIL